MFSKKRVYCIASGEMDGEIKFYFYAKYVIKLKKKKLIFE